MRVVLTNDDGIHAPGLMTLYRLVSEWAEPIVVAPEECHSSMSHCVTTKSPAFSNGNPFWLVPSERYTC